MRGVYVLEVIFAIFAQLGLTYWAMESESLFILMMSVGMICVMMHGVNSFKEHPKTVHKREMDHQAWRIDLLEREERLGGPIHFDTTPTKKSNYNEAEHFVYYNLYKHK